MKVRIRKSPQRMPRIPPTQLVVGSYSAYQPQAHRRWNTTNNVGGSFILSLMTVGLYLSSARSDSPLIGWI
jgi:hypothetical protein